MNGIRCDIIMSPRAQRTIYAESVFYGVRQQRETGGALAGVYSDGIWYIADAFEAGPSGEHTWGDVKLDEKYQSYRLDALKRVHGGVNLIGLWHQHPGGLNVFSGDGNGPDAKTNRRFAEAIGGRCISIIATTEREVVLHPYLVDINRKGERGHPYYERLQYGVSDIPAKILCTKSLYELQRDLMRQTAAAAWGEAESIRTLPGVEGVELQRVRNTIRIDVRHRQRTTPLHFDGKRWRPHGQAWRNWRLGDMTEYIAGRKR